ncbi:uncharacterized protein UV8b_06665 [Ustilaginoidea virens]|uniref:Uncharacterized protein n=1 Tax=Ustilaginoidea virens TaxID=1159556 RepID=A0A8E5HWB6_USTVR|nr:uncharacterized protein UV8b_06665 [Ustilaginoidea virens]QUC22424.1 hypothetical protein UV8b_06665 [Ustilaginoidea virens]
MNRFGNRDGMDVGRVLSKTVPRKNSQTIVLDRRHEHGEIFLVSAEISMLANLDSLESSTSAKCVTHRLGWGSVCVAGAGAYYLAKREITADKQAKLEAARRKRQAIRTMECADEVESGSSWTADAKVPTTDTAGLPSQEASFDPAATSHAAATEPQQINERSKYESQKVYRSPKGDRFS